MSILSLSPLDYLDIGLDDALDEFAAVLDLYLLEFNILTIDRLLDESSQGCFYFN